MLARKVDAQKFPPDVLPNVQLDAVQRGNMFNGLGFFLNVFRIHGDASQTVNGRVDGSQFVRCGMKGG